jgi:predicted nucleic acid-binding Zn ribbon protein
MTVLEAKTALVDAHRNGGDVLKASLAFTRAKQKSRHYSHCRVCGQAVKPHVTFCRMHEVLSRHHGIGSALAACFLLLCGAM